MTKDEWGKLNIDMIIDTNVVLCNGHERCNLIHPLNEVSIKRKRSQISPMAKRCRSTSRRFSGLVRISAVISFVGQKWISICLLLISWRIQCILMSMCFILLWCSGFQRTFNADWLSTDKGDGPLILNPSSPSNERIQMTSRPAIDAETYSASVDEFAIVTCFLADQLIAPFPILIRNPEVDFLVSRHPA